MSLIIWQSTVTFSQSSVQLMRVRQHYSNKVTSALLLLQMAFCVRPLCSNPRRRCRPWIKRLIEHEIKWLLQTVCRDAALLVCMVLDHSLGNLFPVLMSQNAVKLDRELRRLPPGHPSLNHMTGMLKSPPPLPSWDVCHPFDFIWLAVWRTRFPKPSSWQNAARRTEMLCVRHFAKQPYVM